MLYKGHVYRIQKALKSLRTPSYRRALRYRVAPTYENEPVLARIEPKTVIDVGANRGQFALLAAKHWPEARLHCIEPLEEARSVLEQVIMSTDNLVIHPCAAGAKDATAVIYVTEADDSSSLLEPDTDEHYRVAATRTVTVRPIDELIRTSEIRRPVLLKLDVQGYELAVLDGAAQILSVVDAALIEVSFVQLYRGQPLASAVIEHMMRAGFGVAQVGHVRRDADGQAIQADLWFEPSKSRQS